MANEKITLAQLDVDSAAIVKKMQELSLQIQDVEKYQEKLTKSGMRASAQFITNEAELKRNKEAYAALAAVLQSQDTGLANASTSFQAYKGLLSDSFNLINVFNGGLGEFIGRAKQAGGAGNLLLLSYKGMKEGLAGMASSMREQAVEMANSSDSFTTYTNQVGNSFAEINILNGGIGGFVSRAKEAGGMGPLLDNAFKGITGGIKGMGAAIIANPIGAILQLILMGVQAVYNAFKGFAPVVRVVEPGMAALNAVFSVAKNALIALFDPAKSLGEIFGGLGSKMRDAANDAAKLKKEQQELTAAMSAQEVASAKNRNEIAKLNGMARDMTKTAEERKKHLEDAQKLEEADFAARRKNSDEALRTAQQAIRVQAGLTTSEFEELKKQGQNYKQYVENKSADVEELFETLKDAQMKAIDLDDEYVQHLNDNIDKKNKAADDDAKKQADADNARKAARQESERKAQEMHDKEITRMKESLALQAARGSSTAKNLDEQIALAQKLADEEQKILRKELQYKKISRAQYDKGVLDSQVALADKISKATVEYGRSEVALWKEQHKTLLDGKKKLTEDLLAEEAKRLDQQLALELAQLEKEKGTNMARIEEKRAHNIQLSALDNDYLTQKSQLESTTADTIEGNKKTLQQATTAWEDEQKTFNHEKNMMAAQSEYDQKVIQEDERRAAEIEKVEAWREQDKISEKELTDFKEKINEDSAKRKQQLLLQQRAAELGVMQSVASALGEAFGQSKELAIVQANMNGAQAILSIWAGQISGNPVIDTIIKGVLTATTAITTAKQIQNIKSAKKPKQPKFAKGGLLGVGGNRHSAGGTIFRGADGTTFEAEQGELIGVMNRNAARHFMAFNNAFPAGSGSAPNYFAGGGIVSREIAAPGINPDELAAKIAEANRSLPAPVVAVQDIITQGNSYVQVRDSANF